MREEEKARQKIDVLAKRMFQVSLHDIRLTCHIRHNTTGTHPVSIFDYLRHCYDTGFHVGSVTSSPRGELRFADSRFPRRIRVPRS